MLINNGYYLNLQAIRLSPQLASHLFGLTPL